MLAGEDRPLWFQARLTLLLGLCQRPRESLSVSAQRCAPSPNTLPGEEQAALLCPGPGGRGAGGPGVLQLALGGLAASARVWADSDEEVWPLRRVETAEVGRRTGLCTEPLGAGTGPGPTL